MLDRVLHLLICLTVLVCPATGGQCCGDASDLDSATVVVTEHHGCECEHGSEESGTNSPASPSCPHQCHDCFCAGALPPAFETSMPELDFDCVISYLVVPIESLTASDRAFSRFAEPDGPGPPSGRALLTSYCTLLL